MAKLTMRRLFACAFAAVASAASREVQKLRAARSTCTINTTRGPEPTARFVVFTKQRSGSRWFVNALALRSNGSFQSHIPEIEFRGFGLREVRRAKGAYSACHSKVASKKCSCAMRRFFTAHAHTRPGFGNGYADSTHARVGGCVDKATTCHMGYKWMVDTSDTGHRRGKQHFVPYRYDKKFPPGFTAVAASICELRIPYIFMWRKNTLRRMISNAANQHTTKSARRKHIDPHACPVPLTVRARRLARVRSTVLLAQARLTMGFFKEVKDDFEQLEDDLEGKVVTTEPKGRGAPVTSSVTPVAAPPVMPPPMGIVCCCQSAPCLSAAGVRGGAFDSRASR